MSINLNKTQSQHLHSQSHIIDPIIHLHHPNPNQSTASQSPTLLSLDLDFDGALDLDFDRLLAPDPE